MTSVTTTWSPNCFQLRLAFNCRKSPPPPVLLRIRVQNLNCQIRSFSGDSGKNGNKAQWRRMANSSTNPNFSTDDFSGWSATDEGEKKSSEAPLNRLPGGIVGAGVAGFILVAGLAFAALTIGKATSRPKQHMEPLTAQEELSVQNDDVEDEIKNTTIEGDEDSSSYAQTDETATNSELLPDNDEGYTSKSGEVTKNPSSNQDLNNESPIEDILNPSSTTPELPESETDDLSDSFNIETDKSAIEPLENLEDDNPTTINNNSSLDSTPILAAEIPEDPLEIELLVIPLDASVENEIVNEAHVETVNSLSSKEEDTVVLLPEILSVEHDLNEAPIPELVYPFQNGYNDEIKGSISYSDAMNNGKFSSSASMPAPSAISPSLKELPGKVLVPAIIDQVQGQALAALQVLKVIETDVQPGDLCTRREYARWLVSGSSALSRSSVSKVYPAMYIENVTELAFDDITSEDPDFPSIQGLAEAGLIYSKLSRRDMSSSLDEEQEDDTPLYFCPESPLSRQDLVSWKMSLEKRQLPVTDKKILQEVSGFLDIDKIHPDALPALVSDLSAGEQGIVALAFGYTRLFQPNKPVTKAQAAIALATGEAADIVSEELARIEAESMAEKAVAAHSALIDQVEKEVNTSFQDELLLEKEKIQAVQKLAEDAMSELEKLKAQREKENAILMKERATVDTEMELLSKLRSEVEEQLQSVMSNRVEISYEKERLVALRKNVETENQEISRLKYELEVERKALSMARTWAEDEAKRAREQAKVLEEARDKWESKGIKVIVDNDLQEEAITAESTWSNTVQQYAPEETISRAETLVEKLKSMAGDVKGKSRNIIEKIMEKVLYFIAVVKEWGSNIGKRAGDMKESAVSKFGQSFEDLKQSSTEFGSTVKEGAKRVADDCKGGVEKLTHKFKT